MSMKLSEAIRLGSLMKPQGFDELAKRHRIIAHLLGEEIEVRSIVTKTCALGAALDAIGELPDADDFFNGDAFPVLNKKSRCPIRGCEFNKRRRSQRTVWDAIPHLNDDHRWTREAIADWVETVEPADEAVKVDQPQEAVAA